MLNSERTFKIKVRSPQIVFEILLTSAVILHLNSFLHGNETARYLENYSCHKVDQDHFKKVLQFSISYI